MASTCGGTTWSATVGWAYSCAAASGRSRASRRLNEPPILGLAPTGCQARGGRCHEVRVLLGAGGHCGKIDSAKLSVNKQHSLYSCVVLYTMVVEPLTIQYSVGWNYLSISKLQRPNRWYLGDDNLFHPAFYYGWNYLSMMVLKLIHDIVKRAPGVPFTNIIRFCRVKLKAQYSIVYRPPGTGSVAIYSSVPWLIYLPCCTSPPWKLHIKITDAI